jgi:hypothetical protein
MLLAFRADDVEPPLEFLADTLSFSAKISSNENPREKAIVLNFARRAALALFPSGDQWAV